MAKESKKYVGIFLESFHFVNLLRRATRAGKHPSDLVAEWITDRIQEELRLEDEDSLAQGERMLLIDMEHKERIAMSAQLKRLAYTALNSKANEDRELFEEACSVMGVSPHDINQQISNYSEMPSDDVNSTTGVYAAMEWLTACIPIGGEKSSYDVIAQGEEAGFTKSTLENAKRKLGMISDRRPKNWVWMWPEQMVQ